MSIETNQPFPTSAGIFLGLGLGGFFDGIVLLKFCSGTTWRRAPDIRPTRWIT